MRITIGNYTGLTAEDLVERDPCLAEWLWQHADTVPTALRQEVRAALAEFRLARLSYQYDRLAGKLEALKRQRAEDRLRAPSAEEIDFEKVTADGLPRELAEAYRMLAEKDRELVTIKEAFKNLRTEYARTICPPGGGSGSSSTTRS
jgi:hypothetical protein